jgi:hypothetical protein
MGVSVIAIWWVATHGKGTAPGRLVAWLLAVIIGWVMVAITDPSAAGKVAGFTASGAAGLIAGIGHFIGALH